MSVDAGGSFVLGEKKVLMEVDDRIFFHEDVIKDNNTTNRTETRGPDALHAWSPGENSKEAKVSDVPSANRCG